MKYFVAVVNATLKDDTHHFTPISFLIKRHKTSKYSWTYTVKVGYSESLESVSNKPRTFVCDGDWVDALHHTFNEELGWMDNVSMELLREITL